MVRDVVNLKININNVCVIIKRAAMFNLFCRRMKNSKIIWQF